MMQTLPTYSASLPALVAAFRRWIAALTGYVLRSGATDVAQSRQAVLASLGRVTRDEASLIAQGDHLALIGASLVLMLGIALYLAHASHLFAAAR